jgi:hypothetical protein
MGHTSIARFSLLRNPLDIPTFIFHSISVRSSGMAIPYCHLSGLLLLGLARSIGPSKRIEAQEIVIRVISHGHGKGGKPD